MYLPVCDNLGLVLHGEFKEKDFWIKIYHVADEELLGLWGYQN